MLGIITAIITDPGFAIGFFGEMWAHITGAGGA